jgi:hypothetical protein
MHCLGAFGFSRLKVESIEVLTLRLVGCRSSYWDICHRIVGYGLPNWLRRGHSTSNLKRSF